MCSTGRIRKEWNDATESWVDFVRKGKDYHRDHINNPAAFSLIGNVKGMKVLDLACGEGYNTRILARKGAQVVGIDLSEKMIELANQEERKERLGISYYNLNASNLKDFSNNHFDLVTCFMALQDIEHYEKAISEVARVLKNRSRFIFSIPHPCFIRINPPDGMKISTRKEYFGISTYTLEWNMERLKKPFTTTSFHRTLTDYFVVLNKNGLLVSTLIEPRPTEEGLLKHPRLRKNLAVPESIVIESIKIEEV
ncbi:MAG: class I SAM-dependent methyltransferase [Candidatus Hodarchaeota archaeon]